MPTSLVDFQTAYIMTSQLSIIAWTSDKKNRNLYYSLVELIAIAGSFYFELVQSLARLLCFCNIDHHWPWWEILYDWKTPNKSNFLNLKQFPFSCRVSWPKYLSDPFQWLLSPSTSADWPRSHRCLLRSIEAEHRIRLCTNSFKDIRSEHIPNWHVPWIWLCWISKNPCNIFPMRSENPKTWEQPIKLTKLKFWCFTCAVKLRNLAII